MTSETTFTRARAELAHQKVVDLLAMQASLSAFPADVQAAFAAPLQAKIDEARAHADYVDAHLEPDPPRNPGGTP